MVLSTKNSATTGLVNIISYDLLVRMAKDVQEKRFMAIIAVSVEHMAVLYTKLTAEIVWYTK